MLRESPAAPCLCEQLSLHSDPRLAGKPLPLYTQDSCIFYKGELGARHFTQFCSYRGIGFSPLGRPIGNAFADPRPP